MCDDTNLIKVKDGTSGSRKKQKSQTKREKAKINRHSKQMSFNKRTLCNHTKKIYQCDNVTDEEIEFWRKKIYITATNKLEQDQQISRFFGVHTPARRRPRNNKRQTNSMSLNYVLPCPSKGHKEVCQNFILKTFNLSKFRVLRIAKILLKGEIPREKRGGDRVSKKLLDAKKNVREFIGNLKGNESHYGRNKSRRIYLNSSLTISKLFKMYLQLVPTNQQKVSFSTFQRIFVNEYNIGFNSPAADICSMCERLKNSILREKDLNKKKELQTERKIHKMRANCFYQIMKEKPDLTKSYCFDLQQVQPLPKTPVNDAFYLRQISYYTLGIVDIETQKPYFYSWTEDEAGRGATEVSSAVFSFLNKLEISCETKTLRLFCDGCGGQNKNSHFIHTLIYWLSQTKSAIATIILVFPVRGHSFMPPDRAFGRVEKILRREAYIKKKAGYHEIYKQVGSLHIIGTDWELYDVKSLTQSFKKLDGISQMKRIFIEKRNGESNKRLASSNNSIKIEVTGYCHYRFTEPPTKLSLIKRGKKLSNVSINKIPIGRSLPRKKMINLVDLLKAEFGIDWEKDDDLAWYKTLLNDSSECVSTEVSTSNCDDSENCNCLDEEDALHV